MEAVLNFDRRTTRGTELLLLHCAFVGRLDQARPPATVRLELAVGPDLARLLLSGLVRGQARGSSSPYTRT